MKGELEKPFQLTDQPLLVRVLDTFNVDLSLHSISLYFDFKIFLYIRPGSDSILGPMGLLDKGHLQWIVLGLELGKYVHKYFSIQRYLIHMVMDSEPKSKISALQVVQYVDWWLYG